jgi:hypothetical protein
LPGALKHAEWVTELRCYNIALVGLHAATRSDWGKVKECLYKIEAVDPPPGRLDSLTLYLSGVLQQGTANLEEALATFDNERFRFETPRFQQSRSSPMDQQLSLLAALNQIWIMQDPRTRNDEKTNELIEQLRPLCEDNPDSEIRMAYNLVLACIQTNPPLMINQIKQHIQQSLNAAQLANNTQCLSIALNIMRWKLFDNVVGEQALKSAKAGAAQARKSENLLWMSVADGMLALSYEMQRATLPDSMEEAAKARESGARLANEALARTQFLSGND